MAFWAYKPQTQDGANVIIDNQLIMSSEEREVYKGLSKIGDRVATLYLDSLKIIHYDFGTVSNLIGHTAREIDSSLRNILEDKKIKKKTQENLEKTKLLQQYEDDFKAKDILYDDLKECTGHIASILTALDVELDSDFAKEWISIGVKFVKFAHKRYSLNEEVELEEISKLWSRYEKILFRLIGNDYFLVNQIDRILRHKKPRSETINALPNLLDSKARYSYFFNKLEPIHWLKVLKYPDSIKAKDGKDWFAPDQNPSPIESSEQPGSFTTPHWYSLDYLENVAKVNAESPEEEITNTLVKVIDSIIDYTGGNGKRIDNYRTDWMLTKIIFNLPKESISKKYIGFIGIALESKWGIDLVDSEISKTVLPKLIQDQSKDLILELLNAIFKYNVTKRELEGTRLFSYYSTMERYCLKEALDKHKPPIAELCGVEATEIALKKISEIVRQDGFQFGIVKIPTIEDHPQTSFPDDYECQLVHFVRDMFEAAQPDQIKGKVKKLLEQEHPIFKRLAIHVINHHYQELKKLFWNWVKGNFNSSSEIKHEVRELLRVNCSTFSEKEIGKILDYIENAEYYVPDKMFDGSNVDAEEWLASYKKEWLSALLKTENSKIKESYEKYEKISPVEIKHPGFSSWHEGGFVEQLSPIEPAVLLQMSNEEIVKYLNDFKQEDFHSLKRISQRGLCQTFESDVAEHPIRFLNNLKPFQEAKPVYQYSLLQGLKNAWEKEKSFSWNNLFDFVSTIIDQDNFWQKEYEGANYREWIISEIARLIEAGTRSDEHAFEPELLPQVGKTLLTLVSRTKTDYGTLVTNNIINWTLNSTKGKIFSAMVNHSLRWARVSKKERWIKEIKDDFTQRLNREFEPSRAFSVILGQYLVNLYWLDKEWVQENINRIFPKDNDTCWQDAFSAYLFHSRAIYPDIYPLLKETGHFQKALKVAFEDSLAPKKLVQTICAAYINDLEKLDEAKSLINKLIQNKNSDQLSWMITFLEGFGKRDDDFAKEIKTKIKPLWRELYNALKDEDNREFKRILFKSAKNWLMLINEIDDEIFKWLQLSFGHIDFIKRYNYFRLPDYLLWHAKKTPKKVGKLYLTILEADGYPTHPEDVIKELVQTIHDQGEKKLAKKICEKYAEKGIMFLREFYNTVSGGVKMYDK
ncbi:conserved hypothetical protein [Candidatus Desulfarcum epimagneticum]|uniref:Uncharacterized protein n=1 Tax=uncultured Desulfobacteraceae bacterium TaxID=218296 RepID=A0A484HGQ0_9BACT|nr:conserved hypothetical protein [uncultured Desulfobacteraceae bacterium]